MPPYQPPLDARHDKEIGDTLRLINRSLQELQASMAVTYATAAQVQAGVAANVAISPLSVRARASFVATMGGIDQTGIPPGVDTKLAFATQVYNFGGYYDLTLSRWMPREGMVHLMGTAQFTAVNIVPQNDFRCWIYKNGVPLRQGKLVRSSGASSIGVDVNVIDYANGTDVYECWVAGTGAGNKTVSGNVVTTYFQGSAV